MENKHYMRINGFMIHYTAAGSGQALVLMHGGGTWHYTFRHNLDSLSRYFRVYAPDLPGHGYTWPLKAVEKYDFSTVSTTLRKAMDHLGIDRCHLLGHSWGGGWAIDFAAANPDRIDKLILIASSGLNQKERPAWELLKLPVIGRLLASLVTRHMVQRGLKHAFSHPGMVSPEMVRKIYEPLTFSHIKRAQHSYAKNLDWSVVEAALPRIRCPALILWGKEDRYIDVKHAYVLAERMPVARLEIIENCGHMPHEEKPDVVNRILLAFLQEDSDCRYDR